MSFKNIPIYIVLFSVVVVSCSPPGVTSLFKKQTPYQKYVEKLQKSDLASTVLGNQWIRVGASVFKDSIKIDLPFKEGGYFGEDVRAVGYGFLANRGEIISVKATWKSRQNADLFIDLFIQSASDEETPELVASADSLLYLEYEVEENAQYFLRLQPELLSTGNYEITIEREPSLPFPIPGKDSRAVGSFFGVPRDGGKRKHEGIDIFAPRGTPVIAIADGRISSVKENKLGGKVVFLNSSKKNFALYYAHLDTQMVSGGQDVSVGDTIGLVGNTGNAKYTPAHLHFSIYPWAGRPIDPLPFVSNSNKEAPAIAGDLNEISKMKRVKGKKVFVLNSVSNKKDSLFAQNTVFRVVGITSNMYRIKFPDDREGYIRIKDTEDLKSETIVYKTKAAILDYPTRNAAAIDTVAEGEKVKKLGSFDGYTYINYKNEEGWINSNTL